MNCFELLFPWFVPYGVLNAKTVPLLSAQRGDIEITSHRTVETKHRAQTGMAVAYVWLFTVPHN
jgi:hypothetical protein